MTLELNFGHATALGQRERNEDRAAYATPDAADVRAKGYIAALADGVGGGFNGGEAAEAVVRGLLQDYYATPATWEAPHAIGKILAALNRWLYGQSISRNLPGGYASTLTALVFRGRRYCLTHIGDSRAYLLRGGEFTQLTQDHVWQKPGMEHVLRRGMGLDEHLSPDFGGGRLEAGDVFLLLSDGVWEPLGPMELKRQAQLFNSSSLLAQGLVDEAMRRGGRDNATVLVIRVTAVASEELEDEIAEARVLSLPPRLKPGGMLDDFVIESVLHDSRETLLYLARQPSDGRRYVLKTLKPVLEGDAAAKARLLAEEWLGKRVNSPYLPEVPPLPARNYLYYAQVWQPGQSLSAALASGRRFSWPDVMTLGIRLAKALSALHRLDVVHRDIKPDNLHLADDGKLRLLDLGVAACPALDIPPPEGVPGTPSYMAPELFSGGQCDAGTDLYAAGVTLYHLLTRKYPYGEIEPFQHPRFGDPVPASRYRPDLPGWLDNLLLKAVARDPAARFETAEELLLALERGDAAGIRAPRRTPLVERNPLALWQTLALCSFLLNLFLVYLLLAA